jgi:DNA-binding LytR/AlgR family response regulator
MKLNCLIVDDEPIARNGLALDVQEFDFLHVTGLAQDAFRALQFLNSDERIDILFMDIDMPGLSGLDFLKLVRVKPVVIITTAYPQYAIDGFELGVVDYLLKPISTERLATAIDKARKWLSLNIPKLPADEDKEFLYVKCNGGFEKIYFRDILYLEAANNYVFIHTAIKRFITYNTLKGIEAQLPAKRFVKTHKSYIVSRSCISNVKGNEVIINDARIPLSRNFKDFFQKEVITARSLRKE